ncbi:MAG: Xaa-Pro peptidase family protein [Syntrophaceticus schinkii]|jgi:Xaa-Pro dipeptidase|nr:Xaa-Pro peptidase family protein [Syntrophaceticus schinkii]MDD4261150.1 Xaa-Pro peptidase family protein [Syntrophaceticus schinkii]
MVQEVYEKRRKRAYQYLCEKQITKALVGQSLTMYYLTGAMLHPYDRFLGLVLDAEKEECSAIIPGVNLNCMSGTTVKEIVYNDSDGPQEALVSALEGCSLLGVEMNYFSMLIGNLISELNIPVVDVTDTFKRMRMIKDKTEIDLIMKASDCANAALTNLMPLMREGVSEKELALELYCNMAKTPGVITETSCIQTLAGATSASPHGWPGDNKLKKGDTVTVDFCTCYQYYWSDLSRNFFIGEPSEQLKDIYKIVLEANMAAIDVVKPGIPAKMVDQAARAIIEKHGYGEMFLHRTGHGVGLDIHEDPYMDDVNELILEEGMVFTAEPGIYLPNIGGIRIEDDILVTADGHRVLTSYTKELDKVIIR